MFLSDLCKSMFNQLKITLFNTIYHPQTNKNNEKINQILEIKLRYYIHALENPENWLQKLPKFQMIINNTKTTATLNFPDKIIYGFSLDLPLNLMKKLPLPKANAIKIETQNTINWVNTNYKKHYNRKHSSLFLKIKKRFCYDCIKNIKYFQP